MTKVFRVGFVIQLDDIRCLNNGRRTNDPHAHAAKGEYDTVDDDLRFTASAG